MPNAPFGRVLTAMVTPMRPDGAVDLDSAAALATWLVDQGNDGLIINGTTGESATTNESEKLDLVRVVVEAVGDRAYVVAGAGSNDTAHSVDLAKDAAKVGAHGLLVVTPYYNKPPQAGVLAHFRAVADATDLPVLLYDIPGRAGIQITVPTMLAAAEHPQIVGVKDAKGDFWAATQVMRQTDLAWYSGNDADNLLHLAQGAAGFIGVTSHVASPAYAAMIAAYDAGDVVGARKIHFDLVPAVDAIMNITQGAIMSKLALAELGILPSAAVRLPLVEATEQERAALRAGLVEAGLL